MIRKNVLLLPTFILAFFLGNPVYTTAQPVRSSNIAFVNGKWFDGRSFESQTVYSVKNVFTLHKPSRIDTTVDLEGTFVVPPFAEAHNHNLGTGVEEWDRIAIQKYLADGVFYVKIQGNLPISEEMKNHLLINKPNGVDAVFAQGSITATGGHPIFLVEKILLPQGYYRGYTKETLRDFRYFTVDSEDELEKKWPQIVKTKPDFIKAFLWRSDEFKKFQHDSTVLFKGLDPTLLPKIVNKAHSQKLRVSVHVIDAADFHNAISAGVDEIAHLPRFISGVADTPISVADAQIAAKRGVTVITTVAAALFQGGAVKKDDLPLARKYQAADLKLLFDNGVPLAIGSDDVTDNSVKEIFYLKDLGVFDNLTLIKMWSEATPKAIFPGRKIGALKEGYEASFLALEGNPIEDLNNVHKIKFRFKQGVLVNP